MHLFSKKLSGVWPHFSSVAARAHSAMEEVENGEDISDVLARYTTKGRPDRNSESPGRTARFRATSATNFSRFGQTVGSQNDGGALKFAPNSD